MAINYYRLLGIPPDADQQRLKSAYRSLAKRFHPDVNQGSEAAADLFRQINDAYRVLSDPKLRAAYDAEQPQQAAQNQPAQPANQTSAEVSAGEQKFNRFVNSLLDAIFGPIEAAPAKPRGSGRSPPNQARATPRKKPDFSFYYHLERNKHASSYEQGPDGIFRQMPRQRARAPGGGILMVVLSGLWALLSP